MIVFSKIKKGGILLIVILLLCFFQTEIWANDKIVNEVKLAESVKKIYNYAIQVGGVVAFSFLVMGGFLYLIAAGNPKKMRSAQKQIFASFLGLLILLASWIILRTINPRIVEFAPFVEEIRVVEPFKPSPFLEITSGIYYELPVETRIKGIEGKSFGIFNPDRFQKIEDLAKTTEEKTKASKELADELASLSHQCKCDHGCNAPKGCTHAECQGQCQNEERCIGNCNGFCTSDPCCKVRSQIDQNKEKNREKIKETQELNEKTEKEILDFEVEMDKLIKTLKVMRNVCFLSNVISRDNFIALNEYYKIKNWKLKKVRYFEEIDDLVVHSFIDFYCPIGGTRMGQISIKELSKEEIDIFSSSNKEFEKEYGKGEIDVITSCDTPTPFGEIIDKILIQAKKTLEKIKELSSLQNQWIEKIDKLHQLTSECTSKNCSPDCGCPNSCHGCKCGNSKCIGQACPWNKIEKTLDELSELREKIVIKKKEFHSFKEIVKKWEKIKELVEKKAKIEAIVALMKDNLYWTNEMEEFVKAMIEFEKMALKIHGCITEPREVEPGWFLRNCERVEGAIDPDGKRFVSFKDDMQQCFCKKTQKCKRDFPDLENYNCQVLNGSDEKLGKCEEYNYFCCRIKD